MANTLRVEKSDPSETRRLPFLPRIGIVVDVAGRRLTYRHVPLLEIVMNLRARGERLSLSSLRETAGTMWREIFATTEQAASESSAAGEAAAVSRSSGEAGSRSEDLAPTEGTGTESDESTSRAAS
jgi:hypothetical protein